MNTFEPKSQKGFQNDQKTLRLQIKRTWGIHHAQNLIKPVENEDFGGPFPEMAPKMIKKALPREGFRNAFSERRETL